MQVIWPTMGLVGSGFAVQSSTTAVFSSPATVTGTQTTVNPTEATLIDSSAAPPTTYYRVLYTFPNSTTETSSTCQPVNHASGETLLSPAPSEEGVDRTLRDLSVRCPVLCIMCAHPTSSHNARACQDNGLQRPAAMPGSYRITSCSEIAGFVTQPTLPPTMLGLA